MTAERIKGEGGAPSREVPPPATASEPNEKIRDEELYRMAAFRIRETANRIATLANSVRDDTLRAELQSVCQRLLSEERALLTRSRP